MRRLGVTLVVVFLAGCSMLPTPFDIEITIPATQEIRALPVTIIDHAGIVRRAAPGDNERDIVIDTTVQAVPGRDDAVRLRWLGGVCDDRMIVTIDPEGERYRVSLESQFHDGGCPPVGIPRTIVLELAEPVGADAFDLH